MDHVPAILISNDPAWRDRFAETMSAAGFAPDAIERLPTRVLEMPQGHVAWARLFVVDLGLNPADALDWCRVVRRERPAILLCAVAREPNPLLEITALEQGADATVRVDITPRALGAQLRALARRVEPGSAGGDLILDPIRRRVIAAGRVLDLTDAEFGLLAVLYRHRGRVLSRDDLSYELHGRPHHVADRSLDLRVARLRRKLEDDTREPRWIRSVRGEGYLLMPPSP